MNVENILKVADAIEKHSIPDLGFNMGTYRSDTTPRLRDMTGHDCGTVACIAGWVGTMANAEDAEIDTPADYFGIDEDLAELLFCPPGWGHAPEQYTPEMAVATLRHLAATGEVDWHAATSPAIAAAGDAS